MSTPLQVRLSIDDAIQLMQALASAIEALQDAIECHERDGRLSIANRARSALGGFEVLRTRLIDAVKRAQPEVMSS